MATARPFRGLPCGACEFLAVWRAELAHCGLLCRATHTEGGNPPESGRDMRS